MKASIKIILIFILLQLLGNLAAVPLVLMWQFVTTGTVDTETADAQTLVPGMLLSLFFVVWYLWKKDYLQDYRQYVPTSAGYLGWTALLAVALNILTGWLLSLMDFLPDWNKDTFAQLMGNWAGIVDICLLAPVMEELVFRGAIMRELLKRQQPWMAMVVSSFFFGLVHFNPAQSAFAFLLGMLLAWIYWRTRSLVPCIVFHVLNNSLSTGLSLRYPDVDCLGDVLEPNVHTAVLIASAVVFVLALWALTRYPQTGEAGWITPWKKPFKTDGQL